MSDPSVLTKLLDVKAEKKAQLVSYLKNTQGLELNPDSIFDIQVKRLHEYKRQQMNALYVIHKYLEIKAGKLPKKPITVLFGAKAAPAYVIAKGYYPLNFMFAGTYQQRSEGKSTPESFHGGKLQCDPG